MKKTFSVLGYVKHYASLYVKGAKDRLAFAQKYLCKEYNLEEENHAELFPMRTFLALAEQRGVKAFTIVDGYCQKYTQGHASDQLVALLKKQGYAVYSARKRDKEREKRGMFLDPDSLTKLRDQVSILII